MGVCVILQGANVQKFSHGSGVCEGGCRVQREGGGNAA